MTKGEPNIEPQSTAYYISRVIRIKVCDITHTHTHITKKKKGNKSHA